MPALGNGRALGQKGVGEGNGNAVLANWYVQQLTSRLDFHGKVIVRL